jgi:hypothetical protein
MPMLTPGESIKQEGRFGRLLHRQLITVGPPPDPATDFETISEALDSIPNIPADQVDFPIRYTILLRPGYYRERIRMKPSVNLVGISKESVYIQPWAPSDSTETDPKDPKHILRPNTEDAVIELAGTSNITNVSILNPAWATSNNSAIRGRDVRGFGLSNIDVFPASLWPDSPEVRTDHTTPFCQGKVLELTGNWSQCIITALGFTYLGPDSFGVRLEGIGQNADCHFIECFFDALFVETDTSGAVRIRDCFEVHIRNSILRVNNGHLDGNPEVLGAAVDVAGDAAFDVPGRIATNVIIEGSSLECSRPSRRLLNIGPHSDCHFKHSSTESIMLWGFDPENRGRFRSGDIPPATLFP